MQTIQKARLRSGQFAPGQSGNPGGRPKDEHRVAKLARSYTLEAIDTLVELMRDGKDERVHRNGHALNRFCARPIVHVGKWVNNIDSIF